MYLIFLNFFASIWIIIYLIFKKIIKIDYLNISLKYKPRKYMDVNYIFLVNNKSGSRRGIKIKELLNELYIPTYDMYNLSKSDELQSELNKLIDSNTVICICGGDGSISWASSIIDKCVTKIFPKICVVPMGTGNDFSRTLGWGIKNLSDVKLFQLLEKIQICLNLNRVSNVDWWNIEYLDCDEEEIKHMPTKMLCYLSFGYDAKISQRYQADRNRNPERFNSQIFNKLMYVKHGFTEFIVPSKPINNQVSLTCDGEEMDVPSNCRSLKLLNINSAASGVFFWGNKEEKQYSSPALNDNKLEVVSSFGVHNLVAMNMGLTDIKRIQQSTETVINIEKGVYIQIDGEGFKMPKCRIRVTRYKQLPVVVGYKIPLGIPEMDSSNDTVTRAIKNYKKDYWMAKDKNV